MFCRCISRNTFHVGEGKYKYMVSIRHSCAIPFMLAAWRWICSAVASRATLFTLASGTENTRIGFSLCLALTNICYVMVCCMRVCVFAMLYTSFFVRLFGRDAIVRNLLQERRTLRDKVRDFTIVVVVITGVIGPVVLCIPVFGLCAMSSMYSRRFPLPPGAKSNIHSTQKGVC